MTDPESIRTLATVTLDARALDELGPQTIDRLAQLVSERLIAQRAADAAPLLTTAEAARAAGVHPETARRAIKAGVLRTAGYVGNRPRMRREDVDTWVAGGTPSFVATGSPSSPPRSRPPRLRRAGGQPRKLGEALSTLLAESRVV
jgi:excisionase family DNA binding protein